MTSPAFSRLAPNLSPFLACTLSRIAHQQPATPGKSDSRFAAATLDHGRATSCPRRSTPGQRRQRRRSPLSPPPPRCRSSLPPPLSGHATVDASTSYPLCPRLSSLTTKTTTSSLTSTSSPPPTTNNHPQRRREPTTRTSPLTSPTRPPLLKATTATSRTSPSAGLPTTKTIFSIRVKETKA